jgi:hypothetical protein
MEKQNITLSLSKGLLRKIKVIAVQKDKSVSGLLTEMLDDLVSREDAYLQAKERYLAGLQAPFNMGTQGQIAFKREDLHDRQA